MCVKMHVDGLGCNPFDLVLMSHDMTKKTWSLQAYHKLSMTTRDIT